MLNIEVNRSAEGVERYFDRELSVSDYLMKEPGMWAGLGAERLGLRGPVQRSQFVALLRNENPATGKRLTARMNTSRQEDGETASNRQVGYGLVFGVPKSVSIYLAITGDEMVENLARSAVDETMRAMESEMQCKVRKRGLHEDRRTGELLYSKFFHRDSRPINGLSDPHWHVHCFLHNATFDPVEERWKAGQFRGLIADKGYFQEYFHTLLAQRLMESGYKLRRTDRGWHQWEMACITDREVELFSKRHELIDTLSEERVSTPEEERRIAHRERESKITKLFYGKAEIENWRQQMGVQRWASVTPKGAKEGPQLELPINSRELAVEAYFARHSVVTGHERRVRLEERGAQVTAFFLSGIDPLRYGNLNRDPGMRLYQSSPGGGANRFHTTRWSVVLVSAQSHAPGYKEALADLCKLYWYPLYAFIRHRGYSSEDAQDLVQGFFLHLIEYKTLSRVDRSKGKFRSFLLASLQNFLSNEADRARCLKRGGKAEFVYLDVEEAEDRYGLERGEELTPEKIFDARWAMALLGEAMNRLGGEYIAQGKEGTFQALRAFLDPINTKRLPTYEEVAAQLEVSVGSLKMQIHRLRKQYAATIREEISRTVSDSADLDTETHELCEALIAAEGWVML